ncbi:MAG: HU family DNA-binding protein [Paludibacteraceae bacterium]|nr:HU family DNA-binding protein [Paludibacteraceae bacterium]
MTRKELISAIAADNDTTLVQAEALLSATTEIITNSLIEGQSVMLQNFGTFEIKEKKERLSVHPKTGVRTLTPPKLQVNFKPATILKDEVKEKKAD